MNESEETCFNCFKSLAQTEKIKNGANVNKWLKEIEKPTLHHLHSMQNKKKYIFLSNHDLNEIQDL